MPPCAMDDAQEPLPVSHGRLEARCWQEAVSQQKKEPGSKRNGRRSARK